MVSCNLSTNRNIVTIIYALLNTRAYGFLFMDTCYIIASTKFLGVPLRKLQDPIIIKGYNGYQGRVVTHFLEYTLTINSRQLTQVPFLVLNLGNHDLILGLQQFKYYNIKPDLCHQWLKWPTSLLASPYYTQEIRQSLPKLYNKELEVAATYY